MPAKPEALTQALHRILAIRLDNIGDVVMTSPALRALRENYPRAEITLMASKAGSQVGDLLPWVDDVIRWRAVWQEIGRDIPVDVTKEKQLFQLLREHSFDAAFIFTSFSQSPYPPAYACYMAGIPVRVGQSKEFGGALLTHWVPSLPDSAHQVERNTHLLRSVGLGVNSSDLELCVPFEANQAAEEILAGKGLSLHQPFIALAAGASAPARRYDQARYAQAVRQIVDRSGMRVVLLGSPREVGAFPALEALAQEDNSKVISLIGQTSVTEMAAILQSSNLLIANNSGCMHIAAAFRRPMVILFSGTELLEQWTPNTPDSIFLNHMTDCTPCHGFECPYHLECLEFTPEEVANTAIHLLEGEHPEKVKDQQDIHQPNSRGVQVWKTKPTEK